MRRSKYWKKTWTANNEDEALDILLKLTFPDKPVLIPYSDGAAKMVDENLNALSCLYMVPSIQNKQGQLSRMMDKQKQVELAKELDLCILDSVIVDLENPTGSFCCPVILKPVESVEGHKSDICICFTTEELQQRFVALKRDGYERILVQQYLSKREEYCLTGAILNDSVSFSVVHHIRQWPDLTGSGSFSELSTEKAILEYSEMVLKRIQSYRYLGPIDIEFFRDENGTFYLNEFNWRSSGRNFVSLFNGVHSAYLYYCSLSSIEITEPYVNQEKGYSMNEVTDIRHVFFKHYPLKMWLSDLKKTKNFALWYGRDMSPVLARYFDCLIKLLERKRK